jgi:glucokinase
MPSLHRALLVDIGGTNTRVAIAQGAELVTSSILRFRNTEFSGLDQVLAAYAAKQGPIEVQGACVDIAGPVHNGVGTLTNLDWTLEEPLIAKWANAPVAALINDLQAQGHGVADLPPQALNRVVDSSGARAGSTRLVVNVGTGFNAAVVFDLGDHRLVPASESGHANLPIRTEADLRLCRFVENIHGFPAIEDVLSGRGLERVYHWLGTEAGDPVQLPAAEIMAQATTGTSARAIEAMRIFTRIFGTVCGNLSLIHLPFGGVYLVGGVACALGRHLHGFGFAEAFRDKGRFAGMMSNFAIDVIEDDYAALRGNARHLARLMAT